jgi:hypothetical protein
MRVATSQLFLSFALSDLIWSDLIVAPTATTIPAQTITVNYSPEGRLSLLDANTKQPLYYVKSADRRRK